ncbi:hypothetical protein BZA05DRAFT_445069 [Tricharina praecox]|uniref:uncharacterized protein n=1 Tax=Tricharina praecox TaxID=43433 RepID=UPI002220A3DD|nr:uncharacterized protein BZA05DRAFT_445069 [Tricharina praecox]KAI5851907.1 hypothetical protein BZA05DRAFT_445069 [Tricharina praecox]
MARYNLPLLPILVCSTLLFAFVVYNIPTTTPAPAKMSAPNISELQISITQKSASPLVLTTTLRNPTTSPVSILPWNSPLDALAPSVGVFRVFAAASGDEVDAAFMRINRLVPPPKEDVVFVPAGGEVSVDHELKEFRLQPGKYRVEAAWTWMQVWWVEGSQVDEAMLEAAANQGQGEELKVVVEIEI